MIPSDASDDEIGLYVGAGFDLADRPLGIRLTGLREPAKPPGRRCCMDLCNELCRIKDFEVKLMGSGYAGLSPV